MIILTHGRIEITSPPDQTRHNQFPASAALASDGKNLQRFGEERDRLRLKFCKLDQWRLLRLLTAQRSNRHQVTELTRRIIIPCAHFRRWPIAHASRETSSLGGIRVQLPFVIPLTCGR
jgi:hypothetical protein